jgi:hypothetical protein
VHSGLSGSEIRPEIDKTSGFIRSDYVQTVRADGMNLPPLTIYVVTYGEKTIEALVI